MLTTKEVARIDQLLNDETGDGFNTLMEEFGSCLIGDAVGIYVPREFISGYDNALWGIRTEDISIIMDGPDNEFYWEAWDDVLEYATCTVGRVVYGLWQDGDLFALPVRVND